MNTSAKGIALIKAHEGKRLKAYLCPANVWTIGYGHTSAAGAPVVREGDTITDAQASEILVRDLKKFEDGVSALVTVPVTQGQFDALVSFAFNCGLGALGKSGLLRKLNERRYAEVPAEFMKWTRGGGRELPGLVRRRREEVGLWRELDETATAGKADVVTVDEPKGGKKLQESTTVLAQIGGMITTFGAAVAQAFGAIDWKVAAVITVGAVAAFGIYTISERMRHSREYGI